MPIRLHIRRRRFGLAPVIVAAVVALWPAGAYAGSPMLYAPGVVVVGYQPPVLSAATEIRTTAGILVRADASSTPGEAVIKLPAQASVPAALARIRRLPGVSYAVPDFVAHAAGTDQPAPPGWIPNDPGRTHRAGGWQKLQWNFLPGAGVDAPRAWASLIAEHRAGAKGVVVAVLDTGIAFRRWERYRRSPDFAGTRFVSPCDLIAGAIKHGRCTDPEPLDRDGHGTFVAGVIAEATNNHRGLTGLAYRASIMPIRVLDASGLGESSTIAAGIRYAVNHHAQVINLSLQFDLGITAGDIPELMSALRYARSRGVVVVAAAGNDSANQIAYPARAPSVISVGATTLDRCLAAYSDVGDGLDLVAPGGGDDATEPSNPSCHPDRILPDVYQMTFNNPSRPAQFSLPNGWYGTSMSAPAVAAAAAMVIASRVIGPHPTPAQILTRLETTAQPLGTPTPNADYGYGLLDIGAAITPGTPPPAASSRR